jgi:hypothetical protein
MSARSSQRKLSLLRLRRCAAVAPCVAVVAMATAACTLMASCGAGSGGFAPDEAVAPDAAQTIDAAMGSEGGGSLVGDGGTVDVTSDACPPVRIGIFGNPGPRPSSDFQKWLTLAGASATRVQTTQSEALTAAVTNAFDVVILDHLVRSYTSVEVAVLETWIQAGGGVVSMSGYTGDHNTDWRGNDLLAPLGVAYELPLIANGPVTSFVSHPTTAGLTSVTFTGGYAIADIGNSASTRTIVATLPEGTVGYAIQFGNGRGFVWGDEWIEYDSEWSTIPQIKQLWVNVIGWLAPTGNCGIHPPK